MIQTRVQFSKKILENENSRIVNPGITLRRIRSSYFYSRITHVVESDISCCLKI